MVDASGRARPHFSSASNGDGAASGVRANRPEHQPTTMTAKPQHLGIKEITPSTFSEPDGTTLFFIRDSEKWVRWLSEPQLDISVPENLRRMLEVARGSMLYGWFFYPLIAVGQEHCFRLLEAAARTAYSQVSSENIEAVGALPYHVVVKRLVNAQLVSKAEAEKWRLAREIRNYGTHATGAPISPPGPVVADMRIVVEQINNLFTALSQLDERQK